MRLLNGLGRHLTAFSRALDDHWIGDLFAVLCLFGGLWGGFVVAYGMGWQ